MTRQIARTEIEVELTFARETHSVTLVAFSHGDDPVVKADLNGELYVTFATGSKAHKCSVPFFLIDDETNTYYGRYRVPFSATIATAADGSRWIMGNPLPVHNSNRITISGWVANVKPQHVAQW